MIATDRVFAVDGHDGAGKTTLARWLATKVGGSYQRPFRGTLGAALLNAGDQGDAPKVVALGNEGIENAIAAAAGHRPIILDRGWMTVASLMKWEEFVAGWRLWIPTVLCWADLETTLKRLGRRNEEVESVESHKRYLDIYCRLASRAGTSVLRTDLNSIVQCQNSLLTWFTSRRPGDMQQFGRRACSGGAS